MPAVAGLGRRAGANASNTYLASQTPAGIQLDAGRLVLSGLGAARGAGGTLQARFRLAVPPGADGSYRLGCMCGPLPLLAANSAWTPPNTSHSASALLPALPGHPLATFLGHAVLRWRYGSCERWHPAPACSASSRSQDRAGQHSSSVAPGPVTQPLLQPGHVCAAWPTARWPATAASCSTARGPRWAPRSTWRRAALTSPPSTPGRSWRAPCFMPSGKAHGPLMPKRAIARLTLELALASRACPACCAVCSYGRLEAAARVSGSPSRPRHAAARTCRQQAARCQPCRWTLWRRRMAC